MINCESLSGYERVTGSCGEGHFFLRSVKHSVEPQAESSEGSTDDSLEVEVTANVTKLLSCHLLAINGVNDRREGQLILRSKIINVRLLKGAFLGVRPVDGTRREEAAHQSHVTKNTHNSFRTVYIRNELNGSEVEAINIIAPEANTQVEHLLVSEGCQMDVRETREHLSSRLHESEDEGKMGGRWVSDPIHREY
jgi:hypothetical protein